MITSPCRSCKAAIIFRKTPNLAFMPINPIPHSNGTIRILNDDHCEVLTELEAAAAREKGEELYQSHYATCPDAGKFRRKK